MWVDDGTDGLAVSPQEGVRMTTVQSKIMYSEVCSYAHTCLRGWMWYMGVLDGVLQGKQFSIHPRTPHIIIVVHVCWTRQGQGNGQYLELGQACTKIKECEISWNIMSSLLTEMFWQSACFK